MFIHAPASCKLEILSCLSKGIELYKGIVISTETQPNDAILTNLVGQGTLGYYSFIDTIFFHAGSSEGGTRLDVLPAKRSAQLNSAGEAF